MFFSFVFSFSLCKEVFVVPVILCDAMSHERERENIGTLQYYFSCTICRSMKNLLIVCPRLFCMQDKNWGGNVAGEFRNRCFLSRIHDQRLERLPRRLALTHKLNAIYSQFIRAIHRIVFRAILADVDFSRGGGKNIPRRCSTFTLPSSPLLLFTGENFLPRNKFDCRFEATLGLAK